MAGFFGVNWYFSGKQIGGLKQLALNEGFKNIAIELSDFSGFFKNVVEPMIIKNVKDSFNTRSGPGGVWEALAPTSAKSKDAAMRSDTFKDYWWGSRVLFSSQVIGKRTGNLYNKLTSKAKSPEGIIRKATKTAYHFGVDSVSFPYFRRFVKGYKGQPARPINFLTQSDIFHLREHVKDIITGMFKQLGKRYIPTPWGKATISGGNY